MSPTARPATGPPDPPAPAPTAGRPGNDPPAPVASPAPRRDLLPALEPERRVDDWGRSERIDGLFDRTVADFLYHLWFRCDVQGIEHVPAEGGALVVSNHAGALPPDAAMIAKAIKEEHPRGRKLHITVEHFFKGYPGFSVLLPKIGCVPAHPANVHRLLCDERELVLVFPEGRKGTENYVAFTSDSFPQPLEAGSREHTQNLLRSFADFDTQLAFSAAKGSIPAVRSGGAPASLDAWALESLSAFEAPDQIKILGTSGFFPSYVSQARISEELRALTDVETASDVPAAIGRVLELLESSLSLFRTWQSRLEPCE